MKKKPEIWSKPSMSKVVFSRLFGKYCKGDIITYKIGRLMAKYGVYWSIRWVGDDEGYINVITGFHDWNKPILYQSEFPITKKEWKETELIMGIEEFKSIRDAVEIWLRTVEGKRTKLRTALDKRNKRLEGRFA